MKGSKIMGRVKQWNPREFQKVLMDNGFYLARTHGSHSMWKNDNNHITISIPSVKVNSMLARRLIKENNLIIS